MASRKHVPGGPLSGNLTPKATGAVKVNDTRASKAGDTTGDHPPFSPAKRPKSGASSLSSPGNRARAAVGNGPGAPGGDPDGRLNWSKMEPQKACARCWQMADKHENTLGWRHFMALRGAAAYSGIGLGDLFENLSPYDGPKASGWRRKGRPMFQYGGWRTQDAERHARSTVEVVIEKLTGLDQPKTQMVATDVEWELKRQGIWADRFIEGNMHLPQGAFTDTWDLARQGALLSFVSTGTVAARVEPDYVSKRVRTQLRSTLNTFIDPGDTANGQPLSYFDITWENPEYMIEDEQFKGHEDEIWKASKVPPQHEAGNYEGAAFGTRMVKVLSAWRMPFGSFKGRRAMFVGGAWILWKDWSAPEPPLAFFRVNRCLGDVFWGENFIEPMLDPLAQADDIDDLIQRTMRLTSQTYLGIDGTTAIPAGLNALDVNIFRIDSNKGEKMPLIDKPGILHQDYFAYRDRKIATARELVHVPEMHATSQSPAHLQSGRALRLEASLMPEAFARKLRAWRHWVAVDIAIRQVRAAREIGKVEPNWQVTWPGADFDSKVAVEVLDIDDSIYQLRPYAVSELKNTPQERAEFAQELFDRKEISAGQLTNIVSTLYDTPKETKEIDAQRVAIAKTLDDMLHAPEKVVADEAAYLGTRYTPPDPWTEPGAALAQIIPVFRRAIVDGVPQNRRNLIKRLMEDVMAIQMQNTRDAATANASISVKAGLGEALPLAAAPAAPPALQPVETGMAPPPAEALPQNVGGPVGLA